MNEELNHIPSSRPIVLHAHSCVYASTGKGRFIRLCMHVSPPVVVHTLPVTQQRQESVSSECIQLIMCKLAYHFNKLCAPVILFLQ